VVVSLPFLYHCSLHLPALLSFPTRRSSDLHRVFSLVHLTVQDKSQDSLVCDFGFLHLMNAILPSFQVHQKPFDELGSWEEWRSRSEEHTSELQSRFDLVCRLLLEKKKTAHH